MNKIFKRSNYFSSVFHVLIIAMFLLGLNGCGYKAPPVYIEDVPESDENVAFKFRTLNLENNESVECVKEK